MLVYMTPKLKICKLKETFFFFFSLEQIRNLNNFYLVNVQQNLSMCSVKTNNKGWTEVGYFLDSAVEVCGFDKKTKHLWGVKFMQFLLMAVPSAKYTNMCLFVCRWARGQLKLLAESMSADVLSAAQIASCDTHMHTHIAQMCI